MTHARLRLPRALPPRPAPATGGDRVVLFLPARNEAARIAAVIGAAPRAVHGLAVEVLVVDDGSTDQTAAVARASGARVVEHGVPRGLGAAVRTGLHHALEDGARIVAFCDADGEYSPADLPALVAPILEGEADYVVGSRFIGTIRRMAAHRRIGNQVLTRWVAWMARRRVTDGQSGFRALSRGAAADARLIHDYNYAQVLTLDLLARGYAYAEVPIDYAARTTGRSYVRLPRYLREVVPAVLRQLSSSP